MDTSAVVAVLRQEAAASRISERISREPEVAISAASLLECSIVMRRLSLDPPEITEHRLNEFLASARMAVEAVTPEQVELARAAHIRFGKGTGHPARLNYGDCFAYALAKSLDAPLLFQGEDFAQTDIEAA